MQEKADADNEADQENLKEMMKASQEMMEANTKPMQERLERYIGSLLSDKDELKQEIRTEREQMLAKMEVNTKVTQERMDANLKDLKENIKSGQAKVRSVVKVFYEKMDACVANRRDDREETMSCQEVMEPRLECEEPISEDIKACQEKTACHEATETHMEKTEPDPGMMQSVAKHQVALKEDAVVKPVKVRKERHRSRKPAAERRGEPKEMTRGDCGCGRKLAAACRRVSRRARVAWRKRNFLRKIGTQENCGLAKEFAATGIRTTRCAKVAQSREHKLQRQEEDDITPRIWKGRKDGERLWKGPECNSGIRGRRLRQQLRRRMRVRDIYGGKTLYLRKERTTTNGIVAITSGKKTTGLQDRQEGHCPGNHEASKWDIQRIWIIKEMGLVEG
jgi:hypothetical protein